MRPHRVKSMRLRVPGSMRASATASGVAARASAAASSAGVAAGRRASSSAAAPATCGTAMLVPDAQA